MGSGRGARVINSGVKGIFFGGWGGAKSLFLIFPQREMLLPGRNFHFQIGTSQIFLVISKSEKGEKVLCSFSYFPLSFLIFTFPFTVFFLFFAILPFYLASLSRWKTSGHSALLPLAVTPLVLKKLGYRFFFMKIGGNKKLMIKRWLHVFAKISKN